VSVTLPLRVLAMISNPGVTPHALDVGEQEWAQTSSAWSPLQGGNGRSTGWMMQTLLRCVEKAAIRSPYHISNFIGTARLTVPDSGKAWSSPEGRKLDAAGWFSAVAFRLAGTPTHTRALVILNACEGGPRRPDRPYLRHQ